IRSRTSGNQFPACWRATIRSLRGGWARVAHPGPSPSAAAVVSGLLSLALIAQFTRTGLGRLLLRGRRGRRPCRAIPAEMPGVAALETPISHGCSPGPGPGAGWENQPTPGRPTTYRPGLGSELD